MYLKVVLAPIILENPCNWFRIVSLIILNPYLKSMASLGITAPDILGFRFVDRLFLAK